MAIEPFANRIDKLTNIDEAVLINIDPELPEKFKSALYKIYEIGKEVEQKSQQKLSDLRFIRGERVKDYETGETFISHYDLTLDGEKAVDIIVKIIKQDIAKRNS